MCISSICIRDVVEWLIVWILFYFIFQFQKVPNSPNNVTENERHFYLEENLKQCQRDMICFFLLLNWFICMDRSDCGPSTECWQWIWCSFINFSTLLLSFACSFCFIHCPFACIKYIYLSFRAMFCNIIEIKLGKRGIWYDIKVIS